MKLVKRLVASTTLGALVSLVGLISIAGPSSAPGAATTANGRLGACVSSPPPLISFCTYSPN